MDDLTPFTRLAGLRHYATEFSQLGNDYIFSRINHTSESPLKVHDPIRVSGITICLLLNGELTIDVNDVSYDFKPISLMFFHSNSVVKLTKADTSKIDAYMLFISTQFMQNININLNTVNFSMLGSAPSPVIDNLTPQEISLLKGYMELLDQNANSNIESPYSKNAALSLVQALLYQLMQIKFDHTAPQLPSDDHSLNRRLNYVQEFVKLVQAHHTKQRSLAFYADQLFISPKYLSRLIKESTGRSAADWIDQFVLLEAKNMLRFSNKNIQQVAYALNFPTQSSFGKFFKHLTGMSPSEYQKT